MPNSENNAPPLFDRLAGAFRYLSELTARRKSIQEEIARASHSLQVFSQERNDILQARVILQESALEVQSQLSYRITNITNTGFAAIMDDPYEMKLEFVTLRGQSEGQLSFYRDGETCEPLSAAGEGGGGAVDIAAFGLRLGMFSLSGLRGVIIADEPFRYVSGDLQPRVASLLRSISSRLRIQMFIVTHEEELQEAGDIVFRVNKSGKLSTVRAIPRNAPTDRDAPETKPAVAPPSGRRRVV